MMKIRKYNIPDYVDVAGPASEDKILVAERELGVKFPSEYREFLKKYGAIAVAPYQIAGIFDWDETEPSLWDHVVYFTKRKRHTLGEYLPKNLIYLSHDGMETTFYLDCSPEHAGRVIAMGPEIGERVVAESFGEFLEKILKDEDPVGDL
ncbi:SMI1/KNR4 family protein [Thermopetrobacter sp. TC1]|uniref:SMI1/KNR4 family protein n=1 Tax=Thermopetrobacter sp. TC1 TaxID=1495045 RepID=UPI0009E0658A|nr:SMI1/KNR4 family protein [Thermopetrobacter sp. TC1]